MKSFVWFTTLLLLCIELAHAAHITPIKGHRHHRRASTKPPARVLKKRGTRSCTPPASTNSTSGPPSGQVNTANGGGFPSLGFKMPSSTPSSVNGWWSDYKSEVGFLGFSYSVSGCASHHEFFLSLICNFDPVRFPGQSAGTLKSEFKDIRTRFNGRYVRLYGACDRNGF